MRILVPQQGWNPYPAGGAESSTTRPPEYLAHLQGPLSTELGPCPKSFTSSGEGFPHELSSVTLQQFPSCSRKTKQCRNLSTTHPLATNNNPTPTFQAISSLLPTVWDTIGKYTQSMCMCRSTGTCDLHMVKQSFVSSFSSGSFANSLPLRLLLLLLRHVSLPVNCMKTQVDFSRVSQAPSTPPLWTLYTLGLRQW